MVKTIYAIFDKKSVSYQQFFITDNELNLKRVLGASVNSGNELNNLHNYTEDFSLVKLGLIDDKNGDVKKLPVEVVCELLELKKGNENGERTS